VHDEPRVARRLARPELDPLGVGRQRLEVGRILSAASGGRPEPPASGADILEDEAPGLVGHRAPRVAPLLRIEKGRPVLARTHQPQGFVRHRNPVRVDHRPRQQRSLAETPLELALFPGSQTQRRDLGHGRGARGLQLEHERAIGWHILEAAGPTLVGRDPALRLRVQGEHVLVAPPHRVIGPYGEHRAHAGERFPGAVEHPDGKARPTREAHFERLHRSVVTREGRRGAA
jgi:hypothetical protein